MEVGTFFDQAFEAISNHDVDWLAEHVTLPLCLIDEAGNEIDVVTKEAFKRESSKIFPPGFVGELDKHRSSPLFMNWQGYAAADGLLWAEGAGSSFEITRINSPAVIRCAGRQPRVGE